MARWWSTMRVLDLSIVIIVGTSVRPQPSVTAWLHVLAIGMVRTLLCPKLVGNRILRIITLLDL